MTKAELNDAKKMKAQIKRLHRTAGRKRRVVILNNRIWDTPRDL